MSPRTCSGTATNDASSAGALFSVKNCDALPPWARIGVPALKRSVITPDGWKLVYTLEKRSRELYNLKDDPGETKNLAGTEPGRARELEQKLFAHFKAIGHDLMNKRWEPGFNPVYNSQARDEPKK